MKAEYILRTIEEDRCHYQTIYTSLLQQAVGERKNNSVEMGIITDVVKALNDYEIYLTHKK